jgi:EAL domain-containing protein (putative c-di-GMP-specific phosphodiesterase class I)/CheY-like chemotaxis protein
VIDGTRTARGSVAPATVANGRILIVEDQPALRRAYARILEGAGFSVMQAPDGRHATDALATERYEVILTDLTMPGMSGTQLLRAVRERDLDVPVLVVTANPTVQSAVDALELGALRYLIKPVTAPDLIEAVGRAAKLSRIARVKREAVAYLASVDRLAGERSTLEARLERALQGLWMDYQPIVDLRRKQVIAYEALVRTSEPTLNGPGALFTLAEELGDVRDVGRAIRASVARTMTEQPPAVDVFVNLHPSDLLDEVLYTADDPLSPFADKIVLEVTERNALDETAGISARASRLRSLGYRIAIDDLGAGYAGLTYFALLSPEVVKIDMSLVRNIDHEAIKQKLVGSLITLCKELGMVVVAEGVENAGERDTLVGLGCQMMQGYLFARPGAPFPAVRWG